MKYVLFKMGELIVRLCGDDPIGKDKLMIIREKRTAMAKSLSKLREVGT